MQYQLKPMDIKDKPFLLKWNRDSEIRELIGTVFPASEIEHDNWFHKKSASHNEKMWMISTLNDHQPVGAVGLKGIDYINGHAELYIYIGEKEYWGKGVGAWATKEVIEFAFNSMNLHKIFLQVFSYNERAVNLYKKTGFIIEGILKEHVYRNGQYHDKIIMGIIRGK